MNRDVPHLPGRSVRAALLAAALAVVGGCGATGATPVPTGPYRVGAIPSGAVKIDPAADPQRPVTYSPNFQAPVPVPGLINTAGAEDSPFVADDGRLYFFFTPDMSVPVERQVADGVTGIYVAKRSGGAWSAGERVLLQDAGKLALDGCEFVSGDTIWFCSAREGYGGVQWFTAEYSGGAWRDWRAAGFDPAWEVGELHFSRDGNTLYFHSSRPGGKGGLDIWTSTRTNGTWGEPVNLAAVNTASDEGWPALGPNDGELWFSRDYALWRSVLSLGRWQAPEKMFGPLAGEATLDPQGNVYFVHHYLVDGRIVEADIWFAERKPGI